MSDSEKSVRACQAASWLGAVQIGLESGRDLAAVPVRDEPHRGPDQVDHTGLDRGLGPGRLDRLGKTGEPVAFPRALRSRAGGAPSTISTSLTPLLASSAQTCAQKEAPSSAWTQIPRTCLIPSMSTPTAMWAEREATR